MSRHAGSFTAWLGSMQAVLRGQQDADVPCDGCTGCCVSAYPIPLRPDDRTALDRVASAFLSLPAGDGLARMLPRQDGTCPMLEGAQCTIYRQRPRTCRDYDCRIYAAAGLTPDGSRPVIQQRVAEWQFDFHDDDERAAAAALRAAARFIREHASMFPPAVRAHSATAAAVLAVKAWLVFLRPGEADATQRVSEVLEAARAFDAEAARS